jgi:hypothetical protein
MKVNTLPVISAVQSLQADADPRVRLEVEEALAQLGTASERRPDGAVHPATATLPGGR